MKTLVLFFTFFASIMFTPPTHAQSMVSELDEKFHLEKAISERLEQTLKTRLEKDYFDITVEARLKRKGINVKIRDHASTDISTEDLSKWYSNQMRSLSRQIANADGIDAARPFELESLVVTLGLSDRVDAKYREELKGWLQNWVTTSFGTKAESVVLTRPSNIAQKNDLSPASGLSRYQNLLGMIFLGVVFAGAFFFQPRRRATNTTPTIMVTEPTPVVANTTPALSVEENEHKELIRSLKNKIAWISTGMRAQVDQLIVKWSDSTDQNYLKIAAYLEALAEGGISLNETSRAPVPVLPQHVHAALPKALSHLQDLEAAITLSLYQEIYSEILSGGNLLIETRHPEFDFLRSLTNEELINVFNSGNESFKVALLTRIPSEQRRRFSELLPQEELRRILNYSLVVQEITQDELKEKLEQWQMAKGLQKNPPVDVKMKFTRLREVSSVLSRLEETLWVKHLISIHPELKDSFMAEGPHMAFMTEWSPDTFRKFCLSTKTRELAAAAKCLPFLETQILATCGEITRKEIQAEMKSLEDARLHQYFDQFTSSFDAFVEGERKTHSSPVKENLKGVA